MENWKPIPGYEGIYEASDCGRIRTAEGKTTSSALYPVRRWKQRVLKTKMLARKNGKHSDLRVNLWKDGKEKTYLVARLVAMAWCPGYAEGLTVNHKDGNPLNNVPENLEWISLKANIQHAFNTGIATNQRPIKLVAPGGKIVPFRSLAEASRCLGRSHGYLSRQVSNNKGICDAIGNVYEIMRQGGTS